MKRWGFSITLICGVLLACCTAQAQLEDLWKKAQNTTQPTNLPGMALSNDKITGGLKEALGKSTGSAVASTGQVDGYFKNQAIKILLPGPFQTVGKGMRMMGMGAQLDELELSMNRAAEQAAPAAKQIFINAITKMSFDDARKISVGRRHRRYRLLQEDQFHGVDSGVHSHRAPVDGERRRHQAVQRRCAQFHGRPVAGRPELQPR